MIEVIVDVREDLAAFLPEQRDRALERVDAGGSRRVSAPRVPGELSEAARGVSPARGVGAPEIGEDRVVLGVAHGGFT